MLGTTTHIIEKETGVYCACGKILAKLDTNGNLQLYCKKCKKEIKFEFIEQSLRATQ